MADLNTFSPGRSNSDLNDIEISSLPRGSRIAVIGAGAFGGWSALFLQRQGYQVTLIDQWGPGNSRSSSGGETRLIRCIYGTNPFYTALANKAYGLWLETERLIGRQLLFPTGCLWLIDHQADDVIEQALDIIQKEGLTFEKWSPEELVRIYPQIHASDLRYAVFEKKTGYLMARDACEEVKKLFISEGGQYLLEKSDPGEIKNGELRSLNLANSKKLEADLYLFACGPWLRSLFPDVMSEILTITRQEVFYFGLPAEKTARFESLPTWIDHSPPEFYYGVPGGIRRGFKIAFDRRGPEVDPSNQERDVSKEEVEKARLYLKKRFIDIGELPLIESRVCQYSDTPDGEFFFDRHPEAHNLWLLGGGSGHGFKHGPSLGQLVSQVIGGTKLLPANLRWPSLKTF